MSDHIGSLLDAYLDKELSPSRNRIIEDHLTNCEQCQNEINKRRQLLVLLKEASPVPALQTRDEFVGNIQSQLSPRSSGNLTWQKVLKLGWQAVPVGLLLAIIFIQTVSFLGTVLQFFPGGKDIFLGSLPGLPIEIALSDPLKMLFDLSGPFNVSGWNMVTGLAATFIISITYISWMVIWWGQRQSTENHQMVI